MDRVWPQGLSCSALGLDGTRLVLPASSHVGKLVIILSSLWCQACPVDHFELMGVSLLTLLLGGTRLALLTIC